MIEDRFDKLQYGKFVFLLNIMQYITWIDLFLLVRYCHKHMSYISKLESAYDSRTVIHQQYHILVCLQARIPPDRPIMQMRLQTSNDTAISNLRLGPCWIFILSAGFTTTSAS